VNDQASDDRIVLKKMHDLNKRVLADPSNRLQIIQDFYTESVDQPDQVGADLALLVRSIVMAREGQNDEQRSDRLRFVTRVFLLGMALVGLLGLVAVAGGVYAIYLNSRGETVIRIWGASVSTGSVGVACIFIGLVCLVYSVRSAFKHAANLARPDGS
jgi:hypothetical protein